MRSDKAWFVVYAGVILGEAMEEYTKAFTYTAEDYDYDTSNEPQEGVPTRFEQRLEEAHTYAKSITNPQYVNWVDTKFIWL